MTTPFIDVSDAKAHLNIPLSDTTNDDELIGFIEAATEIVTARSGYVDPTVCTQTVFCRPGSSRAMFMLPRTPVQSITSIVPTQVGMPTPDMTQIVVDAETGIVYSAGYQPFFGTFVVTYVVGRASAPASLVLACKIIVAWLWETQRGAASLPGLGGDDEEPADDDLPARALALINASPYTGRPVIA